MSYPLVDCRLLLKQALVSETTLAEQMKPFHDNNMPSMSLKCIDKSKSKNNVTSISIPTEGLPNERLNLYHQGSEARATAHIVMDEELYLELSFVYFQFNWLFWYSSLARMC